MLSLNSAIWNESPVLSKSWLSVGCIITARPVEAQMTQDDVPIGEMKYRFKAYMQAHGFAGDLIITSTTASDLVKTPYVAGAPRH